ncbi:DUF4350 domain-containing protein [Actinoplanes sp. HUAS TT8]|uniref:DUF4350 domain-containing protein n=1 Tax=Actinoplanes sp. HUAS TT8 TaxID=3447453 RepID=UPI003F51C71E
MTAPVRKRRWLRVAIPFTLLIALITGTLIVHAIEQPDQDDSDYLSPVSPAGIGSALLAGELTERGVTVDRETSTAGALAAVRGEAVTLLVTTPDLADMERLGRPGAVPPGTRLVVVSPDSSALAETNWPIAQFHERWATGLMLPECADPLATAAGKVAVGKRAYGPVAPTTCYDGAVLSVTTAGATVTVVGAPDPFRNDRINENGNLTLATGLLTQTPRVIWLDVHHREAVPKVSSSPTSRPSQVPVSRPTSRATPREADTGNPEETRPPRQPAQADNQPNPLAQAFPPAVWASIALLALALLALAVAAARRLGTPVSEPLPSRVPSNETMLGHARLYQRAHARDESLDILRAAARRRLIAHLGLPAGATLADIAEAAGYEVDDVREILADFHPENDAELISAADAVQHLVREITGFEGDQP